MNSINPEISIDDQAEVIIDFVLNQLTAEGRVIIKSGVGFQILREKMEVWITRQRQYNQKLDDLCRDDAQFSKGLREHGFVVVKKYFKDAKRIKPSTYFTLKNWLRCQLKGHTFDNHVIEVDDIDHFLKPLQNFNRKFGLFDGTAFSHAALQLTTTMENPNDTWELSTLDFHIDVPYPNLKAFIAGNSHTEATGNYCVFDLAKTSPEVFLLQTLATGISSMTFKKMPFNNTITEKYGPSMLRKLFDATFCQRLIQEFHNDAEVDFHIEPGDLIISNNMVPHVRKLGRSGWANRRLFIHPLPYAR